MHFQDFVNLFCVSAGSFLAGALLALWVVFKGEPLSDKRPLDSPGYPEHPEEKEPALTLWVEDELKLRYNLRQSRSAEVERGDYLDGQ